MDFPCSRVNMIVSVCKLSLKKHGMRASKNGFYYCSETKNSVKLLLYKHLRHCLSHFTKHRPWKRQYFNSKLNCVRLVYFGLINRYRDICITVTPVLVSQKRVPHIHIHVFLNTKILLKNSVIRWSFELCSAVRVLAMSRQL